MTIDTATNQPILTTPQGERISPAEMASKMTFNLITVRDLAAGDHIPPSPETFPDVLPQVTDPWVVSEATPPTQYRLWWDWVHGDQQCWIPAPGQPGSEAISYSSPLPSYNIYVRRYWSQLDSCALQPGTSFSRTNSITTGVSTTDSQSLSYQLGVGLDGLSASLSETFEHSVTVSSETTTTKAWNIDPPTKPLQFVLWQLMEEIVALTPSGQIVTWPSGSITADIQMGPMFGSRSGYISIPTPRVTSALNLTMITQGP